MHAYVRGVIDFLFEEEDGWVIVDFKTDSVTEEKLQSFIDFYRPQVQAYASEWEQTFGYKVKEAGLYFISLQKHVTIGQSVV
ncbi:ATP-dependent helicase/nuclease subunit A [compost metagenome]